MDVDLIGKSGAIVTSSVTAHCHDDNGVLVSMPHGSQRLGSTLGGASSRGAAQPMDQSFRGW